MWQVAGGHSRGGPNSDRGRSNDTSRAGQRRCCRRQRQRRCRTQRRRRSARRCRSPATAAGQPIPERTSTAGRRSRRRLRPARVRRPAEAAAPRRRQDAGDLVVRAGTAFEEYRQGVPGAIDTLVRLGQPVAVAHRPAVRIDRGRVRRRRAADISLARPQQGQRQRSAGGGPLADGQPAPAGLAGTSEQREAIERRADRRRPAARTIRGAHRGADRPATQAVGEGRRTVRTLPTVAGGDRVRTTT